MEQVRYVANSENYSKIPGQPIAYWVSETFSSLFDGDSISGYGASRQGLITGNNERFLRMWFETSSDKMSIFSGKKWFPYNKGGLYRKWFGNNELVVNWENDGYEIKNYKDSSGKLLSRPQNLQYFFRLSITWTALTSGIFNARYSSNNFIFDAKGSSFFAEDEKKLEHILGFLNSKVANYILKVISPTLDYNAGVIAKLPYKNENDVDVQTFVESSINCAKSDWDSFETSWDFKKHPLI